ncbi:hypothetical protein [Luteimonas sp. MHLX1A]|uniref:hypothetical protein n=1 Tax=Alterluteimonas muca TaxID=2878684 RepID=UPI001E440A0F|nr:hypothetical protein [Luteimonas sp. MHLX1A]MCD9046816.1 hypothetical protein [Luteimonas sp. MHLX1A]
MSKTNPRGLYWADPDLLAAGAMHEVDRNLRRASAGRDIQAWLDAGVHFIRVALRHKCLDRLNELAEIHGGNTRLSERSLDELFESGGETELFVQRLRREAEADAGFGAELRAAFGERLFTRDLALPQAELFA